MAGIACPICGSESHYITDTRTRKGMIRRRRVCESCNSPFFTTEQLDSSSIQVVNSSNKKVPFNKNIFISSIMAATYDFSLNMKDIDKLLIDKIILGPKQVYTTQEIFDITADFLKSKDYKSYVRYAISRRNFVEE